MQTNEVGNRNASFSMARSRLKRVEELFDTISFLKLSLETCVTNLRQRMPKRYLTDLSNELLMLIFRLLEPDVNTLLHLSAVCKRFRRLLISSPHLWARQTMSSHMSRSLIDAIGSRSGSLKLDAVISSLSQNLLLVQCPSTAIDGPPSFFTGLRVLTYGPSINIFFALNSPLWKESI